MGKEEKFGDDTPDEDGGEQGEGENQSDDADKADGDGKRKEKDGGDKGDDGGEDGEDDKQGLPILACDQSAITGESLAVDKYMGETAYYTTGCKRGKAYALVKTSAKYSFVGRTADLVQGTTGKGHFQQVMDQVGTTLLILVMFWILIAWIGGFYHHLKIALPGSQNLLHYALVLFIIGVPVGLPVVTTTTLAVGAAFLARQKAIVQKLTAIESLAVSLSAYYIQKLPHVLTTSKRRESTSYVQTRRVL